MFKATLTRDVESDVLVLNIEGHLTLDEKPNVDPLIAEAVSSEAAGVMLDLSGLEYVDSAGLMLVLSLYNKLNKADRPIAVIKDDNSYAEDKIKELGLMRIPKFQVFESAEDAKQTLARSRA